jgi:hypothetical protein
MEGVITDSDRATMLRCAVAKVGRDELKAALARTSDPRFQTPKPVANALNALRKHPDPVAAVGRTQYRSALPYVAAVISDECLSKTIELLGDHSDDPTDEQLRETLDKVRESVSDVTIAVMLASVADGDMPASDLCFGLLAAEERYGLTDWSEGGDTPAGPERAPRDGSAVTPEQREARRLKKQRDAEERHKKQEAARMAAEQVRRAKKKERSSASAEPGTGPVGAKAPVVGVAPRLTRRAALTPAQEEEFDRDDPWAASVVFAWVPFDPVDADQPDLDGKSRRCVVVAGSSTHLLVRPGYSQGGVKSRDWKSVPLSHWKQSGFDQPTWIDVEMLRVPRDPESSPVGRLSPEDWNSLW